MASKAVDIPVLPGSIRGFATSAQFRRDYPERFEKITRAFENALANQQLQVLLDRGDIGRRWVGPERSSAVIKTNFELISKYSYLIQ
jgi:hypothetical protein